MARDNTEEHIKGLREAADDATVSPVKLPIVNVPLPIVGFYALVPWLFLLLHFNLLL